MPSTLTLEATTSSVTNRATKILLALGETQISAIHVLRRLYSTVAFLRIFYYYDSERGCPGGIVRRLSDKYNNVGREWDRDLFAQASYRWHINPHNQLNFIAKYSNEYLRYCTDYPDNQKYSPRQQPLSHERRLPFGGICFRTCQVVVAQPWLRCPHELARRRPQAFQHHTPLRPKGCSRSCSCATGAFNWRRRFCSSTIATIHLRIPAQQTPCINSPPAISLGYSAGPLTLRGWYKTIFRVPTLNDLYYTQVGNRNPQAGIHTPV